MKTMLAIDQYGQEIWLEGKHPRAELLKYLGKKHCEKMYVDKKDGSIKHIGYIVGNQWFTLLNISLWEKQV